jgi:glyoxylase-like metal-dependent hydrolase (beta-lactamase superfamily II)
MPAAGQAITITGTAQRQAWRDRVLPPVEQVRPGVWSVPTPFQNSPLRYVLAYLLEGPRGPVLIDTGWPSDEAWDGLVTGVRETGHEVSDVAAVLVTHFHADHFGLAHKVREASGAWIGMHEEDARALSRFTSAADFAAVEGAWLAPVTIATRPVRSNIAGGLAGISSAIMPVLDRVASAISDQGNPGSPSGMWAD